MGAATNVRRTQDLRKSINAAHDRIDKIEPSITILTDRMTQAHASMDRMAQSVERTASTMEAHVAECRLLRDAMKEERNDNKGRWDWLMQGAVIGLLIILWEIGKHFFFGGS